MIEPPPPGGRENKTGFEKKERIGVASTEITSKEKTTPKALGRESKKKANGRETGKDVFCHGEGDAHPPRKQSDYPPPKKTGRTQKSTTASTTRTANNTANATHPPPPHPQQR